MSSTDDERARGLFGELFDDVLAPMSEAMRADGEEPFPSKPDASRESYYVPRSQPAMRREDFTAHSLADLEDLEAPLAAQWRAMGRDELAGEVRRFTVAARAAYTVGEQDAEVSPFVYVMF